MLSSPCAVCFTILSGGGHAGCVLDKSTQKTHLGCVIVGRVIGEALQRKGSDAHPQDYLNFYALANRQKEADPDLDYNKKSEKGGAHQSKSFIHVHAKVSQTSFQ